MSQYITTYNAAGQSVFTDKVPMERTARDIPLGKLSLLYTTHSMPVDLSTEADIDQYAHDRIHGLPPTQPCPPNGTSAALIELAPGGKTPNRRTITVGTFAIIQGSVLLHLDGGEVKQLNAGDVAVLRGALHWWTNDSQNGEWAKLLVFAQSVKPFAINGKQIEPEWL